MKTTYQTTGMTRQTREQVDAILAALPEGGGHDSIDVIDPEGEVGHICVFRKNGELYARKGTPDPRNLFDKLIRNWRITKLNIAVWEGSVSSLDPIWGVNVYNGFGDGESHVYEGFTLGQALALQQDKQNKGATCAIFCRPNNLNFPG